MSGAHSHFSTLTAQINGPRQSPLWPLPATSSTRCGCASTASPAPPGTAFTCRPTRQGLVDDLKCEACIWRRASLVWSLVAAAGSSLVGNIAVRRPPHSFPAQWKGGRDCGPWQARDNLTWHMVGMGILGWGCTGFMTTLAVQAPLPSHSSPHSPGHTC